MAFSLFGKKPAVTPAKPAAKPAARPEPSPAATPAPTPGVRDDELISLDFTQPGEMPAQRRAKIEVQEVVHEVPAEVEQAAMLYAANQLADACRALEPVVPTGRLDPEYQRRGWGMLFELYQALGRQDAYEALALQFASYFETSPPAWKTASAEREVGGTQSRGMVSLSGALSIKGQEALTQLLKLAEKNPRVRLELTKVTDADDQGCALLVATLRALKKARKECALGGADRLAALLAGKVQAGVHENENIWLLLLELYQQLGQQAPFEDAAVNYAVTFEVSPPSWETPKTKPGGNVVQDQPAVAENRCALEGELITTDETAFAFIAKQAETTAEVVVDATRLVRMDFIATANLMNVVGRLVSAGKRVRLVNASHLVAALWQVIGLDRVATIETRKS